VIASLFGLVFDSRHAQFEKLQRKKNEWRADGSTTVLSHAARMIKRGFPLKEVLPQRWAGIYCSLAGKVRRKGFPGADIDRALGGQPPVRETSRILRPFAKIGRMAMRHAHGKHLANHWHARTP